MITTDEIIHKMKLRDEAKFSKMIENNKQELENLKEGERKIFDELWERYCNNLEEITSNQYSINESKLSIENGQKNHGRKILFGYAVVFIWGLISLFLNNDKTSIVIFAIIIVGYFCFEKIRIEITESELRTRIKIDENTIKQLRHEIKQMGIYEKKYEEKYVQAHVYLMNKNDEKEKKEYEKYSELHFGHVMHEIIKKIKR
jgi:hypothetical protein